MKRKKKKVAEESVVICRILIPVLRNIFSDSGQKLSINTHIPLCSPEILRLDMGAIPVIPGGGGQSGLQGDEALDSFFMPPRPHTSQRIYVIEHYS